MRLHLDRNASRKRDRVVVAMSGGVDSSVAAALLVERGYEVVGVTLQLVGAASRCCSPAHAEDARRVAERLGMRFFMADYRERFQREVAEAFADAYLAGRTPIPCVRCNSRFKFDCLLERARLLGASAIASGHYARVDTDPETGRRRLRRAADPQKDQTYFLFELSQPQLAAVCFPLGDLKKADVREHARRLGLATAEKPESQEICFVPDGDTGGAVERIRPDALPGEGAVVDARGRVLGRHAGVHRFTVGQRRGLGIASHRRLYVTRIDAETNRVVVGGREELLARGARLEGVNWIAGAAPRGAIRASVRVRYRHAGAPARVDPDPNGGARVVFDDPVPAVAPGQAAVFDRDAEVLGGGWIAEALP
jgi:tRNA-specific 2-thiouridylase